MKAFKFIMLAIAYILVLIAFIVGEGETAVILCLIGNTLFFQSYSDLLLNGVD